jgi:hypothetical protein
MIIPKGTNQRQNDAMATKLLLGLLFEWDCFFLEINNNLVAN